MGERKKGDCNFYMTRIYFLKNQWKIRGERISQCFDFGKGNCELCKDYIHCRVVGKLEIYGEPKLLKEIVIFT